jgi:hypothetical protein
MISQVAGRQVIRMAQLIHPQGYRVIAQVHVTRNRSLASSDSRG